MYIRKSVLRKVVEIGMDAAFIFSGVLMCVTGYSYAKKGIKNLLDDTGLSKED